MLLGRAGILQADEERRERRVERRDLHRHRQLDLLREQRHQLELIGLTAWGSDPYAAGAWAYFRPGQVGRFATAMALPHGRLHFCGEHLALKGRGLEGALETAETATAEVIAAEA